MLYRPALNAIGSPATGMASDGIFTALPPEDPGGPFDPGIEPEEETDLSPPDPRTTAGREAKKAGKTDRLKVFPVITASDQEPCWEALLYSVLQDLGCIVTSMPPCEVLACTCVAQLIYSQAQPAPAAPMTRGAARSGSTGTPTQKFDVSGLLTLALKGCFFTISLYPTMLLGLLFKPLCKASAPAQHYHRTV